MPSTEELVRRRMRRQQFANTLAIMVFALGIVALAAFFVDRGRLLHRSAPPVIAPARKAPAPHPRPAAISPPAIAAAPASVARATAAAQPTAAPPPARSAAARSRAPAPEAPSAHRVAPMQDERAHAAASPMPDPATPPASSAASQSPYGIPGANGATRVLVGIKCVDDFRYEGEARGRHYFSARCESGSRRTVSCIGGGCKIEYAPPPSHLP